MAEKKTLREKIAAKKKEEKAKIKAGAFSYTDWCFKSVTLSTHKAREAAGKGQEVFAVFDNGEYYIVDDISLKYCWLKQYTKLGKENVSFAIEKGVDWRTEGNGKRQVFIWENGRTENFEFKTKMEDVENG